MRLRPAFALPVLLWALILTACSGNDSAPEALGGPSLASGSKESASPTVSASPQASPAPSPTRDLPLLDTRSGDEWEESFPPQPVVELARETGLCPLMHFLSYGLQTQSNQSAQRYVWYECGEGTPGAAARPPSDYFDQTLVFFPNSSWPSFDVWGDRISIYMFDTPDDAAAYITDRPDSRRYLLIDNFVVASSSAQGKDLVRAAERLGVKAVKGGTEYTPPSEEADTKPRDLWDGSIDGIEYRWLMPSAFDCAYGDVCWGMQVRPVTNCDRGLYVEINVLAANGEVIGWTNDSVPALGAGQKAKLVFESFERDAQSAEIASVSCRSS